MSCRVGRGKGWLFVGGVNDFLMQYNDCGLTSSNIAQGISSHTSMLRSLQTISPCQYFSSQTDAEKQTGAQSVLHWLAEHKVRFGSLLATPNRTHSQDFSLPTVKQDYPAALDELIAHHTTNVAAGLDCNEDFTICC